MKTVPVKIKDSPYLIHIGAGIMRALRGQIKQLGLGNTAVVVTSKTVHRLYGRRVRKSLGPIDVRFAVLPDGEGAKTKENLFRIEEQALKADGWGKKLFLVACGGGTIGDVTGFAAAIYKRGTPYINIPTTLLAQIDAAIGGKTAIDLKAAKNILGAFHQPRAVFIDTSFLNSLSRREIAQGAAEAVKYGVIRDKKLFAFLAKNHKKILGLEPRATLKVINACAKIKADIVGRDPREAKGLRTILNFGHTFGHAVETSLRYRNLSHGEAVAIGMVYAAQLSVILGKCPDIARDRIIAVLKKFSLPTSIDPQKGDFYGIMKYDKKFIAGKVRMVLLRAIGRVEVVRGIPHERLKRALDIFDTAKTR